jgi:renal tumor antigen
MYQLIKSMDHMHRNGIFHRDIKPENILIMDDTLKVCPPRTCQVANSGGRARPIPLP